MGIWWPEQPYNALPALPPPVDLESKRVLKATIAARAELARLDEAARALPDPTVLINAIPLLEAQASSEIENVVTTTDELFRWAEDEQGATNPATREALRYRSALRAGFDTVRERPLSASTTVDICSRIQGYQSDFRSGPGTFIGSQGGRRVYTPPEGREVIVAMLRAWEHFIHSESDLDPIVVMAITHYQFEAIHPFSDGNGRTGRILNVLLLVSSGLLSLPILYLSRYIIRTKQQYYDLLLAVTRDGAWEDWLVYILEGVRQTTLFTLTKIGAIRVLQSVVHDEIAAALPRGVDADLLAVLFEQPYLRIRTVVERCRVSRPTATKWLEALVEARVLDQVVVGRDRLFVNTRFLDILFEDEEDKS
ncbi:Fic family protein [uncultured Amnibacterium sp.]|uniref:Fic family protein n=1 Tax=uncultured Amnibacterium sp. TaxID=1631851 RepID=UPI0035CA8613